MAGRIEDYALIGDCQTAALVGRDASIDWLCWPRFDSDACFAALLGTEENGSWQMAPVEAPVRSARRYRDDTLVLETDFETQAGGVRVVDFMPMRGAAPDVVRLVTGLWGRVAMRTRLLLRFDYGRIAPWVQRRDGELTGIVGPDLVVLRTPVPMQADQQAIQAEFAVAEGETIPFVLTYGPAIAGPPKPIDPHRALADTETFWRDWAGRHRNRTDWPEQVTRSLITVKALTNLPTGGVVAAATTSLPEEIGESKNWDYRYCWIRDATFTMSALLHAGYQEEATAWRDWLLRAVAGSPDRLQIMYRLDGARHIEEWPADWLPGYEGSCPVRIGNSAFRQTQLDVYGELLDALFLASECGIDPTPQGLHLETAIAEFVERVWQKPSHGLWEQRGEPRHHTVSKVFAWVGIDRFIRSAEKYRHMEDAALDRFRTLRQRIHEEVCARGYSTRRGCFTRLYGSSDLDAGLLLMPLVGFLPPEDPRIVATVESIQRELSEDGLVWRYRTHPDLHGEEGAFIACGFWMVDCLVLLRRRHEARALFERMLRLANDVGLLAEEYSLGRGRLVGNFPQAFSHVALINSALNLCGAPGPAHQRSGQSTEF